MSWYYTHKVIKIIHIQIVTKSNIQKWISYNISHILKHSFLYYPYLRGGFYCDYRHVRPGHYDIFILPEQDDYYYLYMKSADPQYDDVKLKITERSDITVTYLGRGVIHGIDAIQFCDPFIFYLGFGEYFLYIILFIRLEGEQRYTKLATSVLFYKKEVISYHVISFVKKPMSDHKDPSNIGESMSFTIARLVTYYMLEYILKSGGSRKSKRISTVEVMDYPFHLSYCYSSSSQDDLQKASERLKRLEEDENITVMMLNDKSPVISFCQNLDTGLTAVYLYHKGTLHTLVGYFDKLNKIGFQRDEVLIRKSNPVISGLDASYVAIPMDKLEVSSLFCHMIQIPEHNSSKIVSFINLNTGMTHVRSYRTEELNDKIILRRVPEVRDSKEVSNFNEALWYNIIQYIYPDKLYAITDLIRKAEKCNVHIHKHGKVALYFTSEGEMTNLVFLLESYQFVILNVRGDEGIKLYKILSSISSTNPEIFILIDNIYVLMCMKIKSENELYFYAFKDGELTQSDSFFYDVYGIYIEQTGSYVAFYKVSVQDNKKYLTVLDARGTIYTFNLDKDDIYCFDFSFKKCCDFYIVNIRSFKDDYYVLYEDRNGKINLSKMKMIHKITLPKEKRVYEDLEVLKLPHGEIIQEDLEVYALPDNKTILTINATKQECHKSKNNLIIGNKTLYFYYSKIILPLPLNNPKYGNILIYDADKRKYYLEIKPNTTYVQLY